MAAGDRKTGALVQLSDRGFSDERGKSGNYISSSLHSCRAHFPLKTIFTNPGARQPRSLPSQPRCGGGARAQGRLATMPLCGTTPATRASLATSSVPSPLIGLMMAIALQTRHRWVIHPVATAGWMAFWVGHMERSEQLLWQLRKGSHRGGVTPRCPAGSFPTALWGAARGGAVHTGRGEWGAPVGSVGAKGRAGAPVLPAQGDRHPKGPPIVGGAERRRRGAPTLGFGALLTQHIPKET